MDWSRQFAGRTERMTASAIRELLKLAELPDFISFAGGRPAPELFPTGEVAAVANHILQTDGAAALQYGATEGYRPLRDLLAQRMSGPDVSLTADNVLITTGSQQGLDLLGKVLVNPGDRVAVESPTYLAALQAWNAYEAEFRPVRSDRDGLEVDSVADVMGHDIRLLYTVPNFQNPRGVTLSGDRRERLVALCLHHDVPLVEDDPYHDLRFEGPDLPRLVDLDARQGSSGPYSGGVVSLGTFSKILAPGIRVGWVIAAPELIRGLTLAKQGTDLHTSSLDQMIAYEMLKSGFLSAHRATIVAAYRERRDVMIAALRENFPTGATWSRPEGGMFLWVELEPAIDTSEVQRRALAHRVAFVPGTSFYPDGRGANSVRLNFSNSTPEQIWDGIGRIARAARETVSSAAIMGERPAITARA